MGNDPRWKEVVEFLNWVGYGSGDTTHVEYRRRYYKFTSALAAIPPCDRDGRHANKGQAIEVAASIAADESVGDEVRTEARLFLSKCAEQMRAEGTDIVHWLGPHSEKRQ